MLDRLHQWLAIPGNTTAKLAAILGYKTSQTIENWISRSGIPYNRQKQLGEYFDEYFKERNKGKNKKTSSSVSVRGRRYW